MSRNGKPTSSIPVCPENQKVAREKSYPMWNTCEDYCLSALLRCSLDLCLKLGEILFMQLFSCLHTDRCVHACRHAHACMHACRHMYTRTHTWAHTHTHTYTQGRKREIMDGVISCWLHEFTIATSYWWLLLSSTVPQQCTQLCAGWVFWQQLGRAILCLSD